MRKVFLFFAFLMISSTFSWLVIASYSQYKIQGRNSDYLGNVIGMSTGVPQNEFNLLARDLGQQKASLDAREKLIDQREDAIRLQVAESERRLIYLVLGITSVLLFLILLNFVRDSRRNRNLPKVSEVIDLRSGE